MAKRKSKVAKEIKELILGGDPVVPPDDLPEKKPVENPGFDPEETVDMPVVPPSVEPLENPVEIIEDLISIPKPAKKKGQKNISENQFQKFLLRR